jgi:superfamily II DNA/RNA helicase
LSSFLDLGVPRKIDVALARRGITAPFAIQTQTITHALDGRDVCGRAPTGSGKTLAFSIPLAAAAIPSARAGHPTALILVPTRELASQVAETLQPLAQAMGRRVATFYGGTPIANDQRRLRKSIDIAVACPGRLTDLVNRGDVYLDEVTFVVLDEADRMADMGFLPDVQRLLDITATDRQTLLFSATLDGDVDVLIRRYQHDPVRVELHTESDDAGDVRHLFWHSEPHDRVRVTGDIIAAVSPAIVFTRTKHSADRVAKQLQRRGVTAVAIHGNRTQKQRERALADFTAGRAVTLVATDVAARGIHVDNVGVVVHFDPPASSKDYVHRSGRTGRAGADGVVVTLVSPDKRRDVKTLQRELSVAQSVDTVSVQALLGNAPARPAPAATAAATPAAAPGSRRPPRPRQPEHRRPGRGNPPKRRRTAV